MSFNHLAKLFGSAIGAVSEHLDTGASPVADMITKLIESKENGDTLKDRLTATRSGYLDNLLGLTGARLGYIDNLLGLTGTRLGYIDNLLNLTGTRIGYLDNLLGLTGTRLGYIDNLLGLTTTRLGLLDNLVQLVSGGDLYNWLQKIGTVFSVSTEKLTHLAAMLGDLEGAFKTNVKRMLNEKLVEWGLK
jgi:hypothetical protein